MRRVPIPRHQRSRRSCGGEPFNFSARAFAPSGETKLRVPPKFAAESELFVAIWRNKKARPLGVALSSRKTIGHLWGNRLRGCNKKSADMILRFGIIIFRNRKEYQDRPG